MRPSPPPTSVTSAQALDERYGLSRTDQHLRGLTRQIVLPGNLGVRLREQYSARVTKLAIRLREHGFHAPTGISDGILHVGDAENVPFRLRPDEILRHILVPGSSGSGKTTMLRRFALQLRVHNVHVITLDYKHDMRSDAALDQDYLILHPDAPFNILDHDPACDTQEHITT